MCAHEIGALQPDRCGIAAAGLRVTQRLAEGNHALRRVTALGATRVLPVAQVGSLDAAVKRSQAGRCALTIKSPTCCGTHSEQPAGATLPQSRLTAAWQPADTGAGGGGGWTLQLLPIAWQTNRSCSALEAGATLRPTPATSAQSKDER